ncbi:MAG: hypothetical protein ACLRT4_04750 [Thomasclavelia sp.]
MNSDFLEYFEKDYYLEFMDITQHYGMWNMIGDADKDDIYCQRGLQNYINHCKNTDINNSLFKQVLGLDVIDIRSIYPEKNAGFEVIDEFTCGNHTVVLAMKNKKYHKKFVTWRTTPNRHNGYDIGDYFTTSGRVFADFKKRSQSLFEHHFEKKHSKFKARFKKEEIER